MTDASSYGADARATRASHIQKIGSGISPHNMRAQVTHMKSVGKYMALFAHAVVTSLIPMRDTEIATGTAARRTTMMAAKILRTMGEFDEYPSSNWNRAAHALEYTNFAVVLIMK